MNKNIFATYEDVIQIILNKYKENYMYEPSIQEKIRHITECGNLAMKIDENDELLYIASLYHDIGRFRQFDYCDKFDDNIASHSILGLKYFEELVEKGALPDFEDIGYIKIAIRWHEQRNVEVELSDEQQRFLDKIRGIDCVENGFSGVIHYLEREIDTDAKGYLRENPNMDMKFIRPLFWYQYLGIQPMQKNCITYAEYLLFASYLAISAYEQYPIICREYMNERFFDWCDYMFSTFLYPQDARKVKDIFNNKME